MGAGDVVLALTGTAPWDTHLAISLPGVGVGAALAIVETSFIPGVETDQELHVGRAQLAMVPRGALVAGWFFTTRTPRQASLAPGTLNCE